MSRSRVAVTVDIVVFAIVDDALHFLIEQRTRQPARGEWALPEGFVGEGESLDLELLRLIASERDDHALEQALLLKERHEGTVTVLALDAPEVDDALYTALAKGADRAVKIRYFMPASSSIAAVPLVGAVWGPSWDQKT